MTEVFGSTGNWNLAGSAFGPNTGVWRCLEVFGGEHSGASDGGQYQDFGVKTEIEPFWYRGRHFGFA